MKKICLYLILFLVGFISCSEETPIDVNSLPAEAQSFIVENFSQEKITSVFKDNDEYEVYFNNGSKIEFNKNGSWKDIFCPHGVPIDILPIKAKEYLGTNYPTTIILEVEKKYKVYEVTLQNQLEIIFNSDGDFLSKKWDT